MPPVKDEQSSARPLDTTAQIQQIFSEIQSQLPSVNFDNDDQNIDDNDNEEVQKKKTGNRFLINIFLYFIDS